MTMPRPSGKALAIAKRVVPGLQRQARNRSSHSLKEPQLRDDVELKVIEINEQGSKPLQKEMRDMAKKKQGYNARLDESLGARRGAEKHFRQSLKDRRDESKGMEKRARGHAYAAVKTMDRRSKAKSRKK